MKFLPGTDPAIIQQHLDKWNKDVKVAPIKADTLQDNNIKNLAIKKTPGIKPKAYTDVMTDQRSTLTDWSPKNQSGADLWHDEVKSQVAVPQAFQGLMSHGPTLEKTKSFIPGANATGVRMARSAASRTGTGLTGTDQFKQQRTGEGLTPREPKQGLNLEPTVHDQNLINQGRNKLGKFEIPNTGVGTGERWSGRGQKNILAEKEFDLLAKKNQQNLLINKR
tara:strand:- start:16 stop:681 length:666 start_codon:yes stop_codon:yes gene_type:complete